MYVVQEYGVMVLLKWVAFIAGRKKIQATWLSHAYSLFNIIMYLLSIKILDRETRIPK